MRHAGNFNPKWGYIAPAPNFLRTVRVFVVAAVIGAMASSAVVFSLMDRPVAETSVAARTLVQPVEPALPARSAPLVAQPQPQSEQTSVSQTERAGAAAMRPQGGAVVTHAGASSPAGAGSTTQRPPIAALLAEAPRIVTTDAPTARVLASEPNAAAAPEAAPVAAAAATPTPTPAPRAVIKKPRAVARAAPHRYDMPRYGAPRYEPRYDSMERGPYAFLRQYGSYGQEY